MSVVDRKKGKEFSKVCRYFIVGNCKNVDCTFIHPEETTDWADLPVSPKRSQIPCRNVKHFGFCKFEEKCPFKHLPEEGWKKVPVKAKKVVEKGLKSPPVNRKVSLEPSESPSNPQRQLEVQPQSLQQPPALAIPVLPVEQSRVLKVSSLSLNPDFIDKSNFNQVTTTPPPSYKSLLNRINSDDPELWNLPTNRDPETTVMYREMTLWGLDRNNEIDYVKYFERKQKLALHQASLDYFVRYEMEIMGLSEGDELAYYEMKKQMTGHARQQEEWCREEMPKLGLKWKVPSDYTTYYGIKMDIAANPEDEGEEELDLNGDYHKLK